MIDWDGDSDWDGDDTDDNYCDGSCWDLASCTCEQPDPWDTEW